MKWKKNNSGKIQFLLFYFIIVLVVYSLWTLRIVNKEGGDFYSLFLMGLLMWSPFLIPAIFIVPIWIIRKKIPREIHLTSDKLNLIFNKSDSFSNHPNLFAYSYHKSFFYSVITFQTKFRTSRGHYIYRSKSKIIAPEISISWNSKDIGEIKDELDKLKVEERFGNKNDNFIDHLIGQ